MDDGVDFIQWLGHDMCIKILRCLEDPSDLVRVCAVSSSWRRFDMLQPTPRETKTDDSSERACLEREHNAYASLSRHLISSAEGNIRTDVFHASSTNNYPEESINNTLMPCDRDLDGMASYWSSEGQTDPTVSETLIYELDKGFCLTEVHIHPFEGEHDPFEGGHKPCCGD